jgi:hypothetical protein
VWRRLLGGGYAGRYVGSLTELKGRSEENDNDDAGASYFVVLGLLVLLLANSQDLGSLYSW